MPSREEYMEWVQGSGQKEYQRAREAWMNKNRYNAGDSPILPCENLDLCYEVLRIQLGLQHAECQ